ncbi:hypothetical protein CLV35_1284 [Motilibacter peucedani]|uniref:Uncharacterized protein n=1 Tax=Motilibacter peucedani TaxID=598650 RepID=A0A420XRZ0_9ACTN|nr:hypothetical protein CLV35_1284 [Motilibacter peucedani]
MDDLTFGIVLLAVGTLGFLQDRWRKRRGKRPWGSFDDLLMWATAAIALIGLLVIIKSA